MDIVAKMFGCQALYVACSVIAFAKTVSNCDKMLNVRTDLCKICPVITGGGGGGGARKVKADDNAIWSRALGFQLQWKIATRNIGRKQRGLNENMYARVVSIA